APSGSGEIHSLVCWSLARIYLAPRPRASFCAGRGWAGRRSSELDVGQRRAGCVPERARPLEDARVLGRVDRRAEDVQRVEAVLATDDDPLDPGGGKLLLQLARDLRGEPIDEAIEA